MKHMNETQIELRHGLLDRLVEAHAYILAGKHANKDGHAVTVPAMVHILSNGPTHRMPTFGEVEHNYEKAILGMHYDDAENGGRFTDHDFRCCLLAVGAPVERYHRRQSLDTDGLLKRVAYIDQLSDWLAAHFGTIGVHGSFLPQFAQEYEYWFTQCVTDRENDNDK